MIDIPIQHVEIVQEYVIEHSQQAQQALSLDYEISEIDLSFSDALIGLCSGDTSSGPSHPSLSTKHNLPS